MKTTIVNYENVYEFDELIDFLRDELDFDLYEDGNSIIQLFEGDPDCLFIDNKKIIFTEFNINENLKAVIYINLYDIDDTLIENKLQLFYSDEEIDKYFKFSLTDKIPLNGVAYRGGAGYTYSIYNFA